MKESKKTTIEDVLEIVLFIKDKFLERFDGIDTRLDGIDWRLDKIERKIATTH